jgi:hypothetical protein
MTFIAKDVTEAKLVIEVRKEAHGLVEQQRRHLASVLQRFQDQRMDFLYDRQVQILLNRGQVEVEVSLMEPIAKVSSFLPPLQKLLTRALLHQVFRIRTPGDLFLFLFFNFWGRDG